MWTCQICERFSCDRLQLLLQHVRRHSNMPFFSVRCGVQGCAHTYKKFQSYYKHVMRAHGDLYRYDIGGDHNLDHSHSTNEEQEPEEEFINVEDYVVDARDDDPPHVDLDLQPEQDDETEDAALPQLDEDSHNGASHQAAKSVLKWQAVHRMPQNAIDSVIDGVNDALDERSNLIKEKVHRSLEEAGIDPSTIQSLPDCFSTPDPFAEISTAYKRKEYIKRHFSFVEPEEVALGQRIQTVKRGHRHVQLAVDDVFYYIPLCESLEQFLSMNQPIRQNIMSSAEFSKDGYMQKICDGEIFQSHPIFKEDNSSLQIVLYYDELEVCNPLGAGAGVHKLGMVYYTLANLNVQYRSKLFAYRLVACIEYSNVKEYSLNPVWRRIKADLDRLKDGVTMGNMGVVRGACICFCADTPAAHDIGGFKSGVGFAHQKCRNCECTSENINECREAYFVIRTEETYAAQCSQIEHAPNQAVEETLKTAFGICGRSAASGFPHFMITKMIPQDAMHVLFEGVAILEIRHVLRELICNRKLFSMHQLNNHIKSFPKGYMNSSDWPREIPLHKIQNNEGTLKQKAAAMKNLIIVLPLILIEMLGCRNDFTLLLSSLCEITKIILSPVIKKDSVQNLRQQIEQHLQEYKRLFREENLTPKQHYMLHLPTVIEQYGPVTNTWCMRFEGKHKVHKRNVTSAGCFKNVAKTCAERNQLLECWDSSGDNNSLHVNNEVGPLLPYNDGNDIDDAIMPAGVPIHETKWVSLNGDKFVAGKCCVAFGEDGEHPEFGDLCSIYVCSKDEGEEILFKVKMLETRRFDAQTQAYVLCEPQEDDMYVVKSTQLFIHKPLHRFTYNGKCLVITPYDMKDVVQYFMDA